MNKVIDDFIKENERAIIEDIAKLVAVRSVEEKPELGAPYGKGPAEALRVALDIAKSHGLSVSENEKHVGWAHVKGKHEEYIATITHVDIVPEGEGWHGDPLVLCEKDGWLIGRGVADDKGPCILSIYLAKFLKENAELKYSFRALFGTNEETGMCDVENYVKNNKQPLFCFSPDGGFPLCNGEKGIYDGKFFSSKIENGNIKKLNTGLAINVVPGKAGCVLKQVNGASVPKSTGKVQVRAENKLLHIEAEGTPGHSASPEGTLNAIKILVNFLLENNLCTEAENKFLRLCQKLHKAADASGIGLDCSDERFGKLTCNGGMLSLENGVMTQSVDIRYPESITSEEITKKLSDAAMEANASYKEGNVQKPFYLEENLPEIKALLAAYKEVTGEEGKPFTMGGGTYARRFAKAVSFGPAFTEEELPSFGGPVHGANEACSISGMKKALKIYILAMLNLQELDL